VGPARSTRDLLLRRRPRPSQAGSGWRRAARIVGLALTPADQRRHTPDDLALLRHCWVSSAFRSWGDRSSWSS